MMKPFQLYNDLQLEIEVIQDLIESNINERKQWLAGGRLFNTVPLDNAFLRVDKLSEKIEALQEELAIKQNMMFNLRQKLNKFEGLEYRVAYMRTIEKKKLNVIADELGYSYDYIREVNARIKQTV